MNCTFKITRNAITSELKKASNRYGVPLTDYITFAYGSIDENAELTDSFKQLLSEKLNTPIDKLESDKLDDIVKIITDEYNKIIPDVNYFSDNELSYEEIRMYGYDSVYAREFGKKISLNLVLAARREINEQFGDIQTFIDHIKKNTGKTITKFDAYTDLLKSKLVNRIVERAIQRGIATKEEINNLISKKNIVSLEKLFGKEHTEDTNLLAIYKEFIADRKAYAETVFKNSGEFKKVIYEREKEKQIEEADNIEDANGDEESNNSTEENDVVDNYIGNLTNKLGDVGHYMSNVDDDIKLFFSTIPKLTSVVPIDKEKDIWQYDTNNPIGIPDIMDPVKCINTIFSHSRATNVTTMIDEIKRIASDVPDMFGLIQVASYAKKHPDFAYKLWTNFSKTIMGKTEVSNISGNFQARQSNHTANKESVLKYELINSFKISSLIVNLDAVNYDINDINKQFKSIKEFQTNLDLVKDKAELVKLNKELEDSINNLIPSITQCLKYFFNTLQNKAVEKYIENSENKVEEIEKLINSLKDLVKLADISQSNDAVLEIEREKLRKEKRGINKLIKDNEESVPILSADSTLKSDLNKLKKKIKEDKQKVELIDAKIKKLYDENYIAKDFMAFISDFSKKFAPYSNIKTDLNSRNVHGNLSSDLINNSMITNILKTLSNPISLQNLDKYKSQSRQYDFSPIMIEHKDENGEIINYGLFTYNEADDTFTPTEYAHRLLSESLFSGVADVETELASLYSELKGKTDYITTAIYAFFKNEDRYDEKGNKDGGPSSFANYFMRTPSDAAKNFIIRAPRYAITGQTSKEKLFINKEVNRNHPVYRQLENAFIQELQDAATAISVTFNTTEGLIDITKETEDTIKDKIRLRQLYKNYDYKDGTLWKIDNNGKKVLTGNVYHSDRFTLVDPISGKLINYGDKIIYGDENNEGAFDFFYGGANPLLVSESEKGVTVKITDKQRDIIYKHLSQFIKDYSEQCYERAKECSHLFGESTFDKIDLVEFALNYQLAYIGFNDLFEGDSKFYKSPQDALKRFKEAQGSGVSYGVTDYNIDYTQDNKVLEDAALTKTTFIKKTNTENGVVEEKINIPQTTHFKGVTIVNTIRTGDSIGTFKTNKKGDVVKWSEDENGNLVEDETNGHYIFETIGRLSQRLIDALTSKDNPNRMTEKDAINHAASIMSGYVGTTVNDAQSYITFEEWIKRIAARGQLEKYKPLIDAIYDETKPLDAQTIKQFIQVQKNFYYDQYFNPKRKVIAARQIKNAEFVLVPRLIEGTQLEQVYKLMKKAKIDQLNTEETSKAGKCNVLTLWDNNGEITEENARDFVINAEGASELFNYNYLYTQQETPSHMASENKAAIQFMKKIIDNIDENNTNKELVDLKHKFQRLYVENIISSAEDFADELGLELDENGNLNLKEDSPINQSAIYDLLKDEMSRKGLDSNSEDYVTFNKDGIPIMPSYFGHFHKKFENIVQGLINNRITRQTLPGFHAAQITNIGFKPLNEFVKKRSYSKELKYHPNEYYLKSDESKNTVISEREWEELPEDKQNLYAIKGASSYIEIMIPKSNFKFNRKNKEGIEKTDKELLDELRESGADMLIGYRIPTEGKQSICIMKVVGFTDDAYDSTIVVPDDWVSQTGSDFDIDSVYAFHYTTELDENGKITLAKTKTPTPKDYVRYIKRKLKYVLKNKNIDTSIKTELEKEIEKYNEDANEQYETLKEEANNIFDTAKYTVQNIIKKYNKGKTADNRKQYMNKLARTINGISSELKENNSLNKKEIGALKLYAKKIKAIHDFLKTQNENFFEFRNELNDRLNSELVSKLSELAEKYGIPTYEKFIDRKTRSINKDVRNNELLTTAIKILSSDYCLEENLSRSNFEKLIEARDAVQPKAIKEARKNRSCYNFFDQAAYQEDAMSGAKLKGASVMRDTFVSICNTVKPYIAEDSAIKVVYSEKDGYKLSDLKKMFPIVTDNKNGTFTVLHNTLGWTKNNRSVSGLLLTPYTSETTAHILDAIKEGAIPNVNDYTFNVYKTFSDIGCDFHLAVAFMMQPAITMVVEANNKRNSIYAEQDSTSPIKTVLVTLANSILGENKFNTFTTIKEIISYIEGKYPNVKDYTLNFNDLNERLKNGSITLDTKIHDFKTVVTFMQLRNLASEISNNAKLLNPDKFGAKQTVFETIDIIDDIKLKQTQPNNEAIIYTINKEGKKVSLINSIYTEDSESSLYPTLNAFYKYSTQLSVDLARLLFRTHSKEFDNFLKSIFKFVSTDNREAIYESFRNYTLNTIYCSVSTIKNGIEINDDGKIIFNPDLDRRNELVRIYGLNKKVDLFVRDSETKRLKIFSVEDINNPTVEELKQFSTLSPAQKVHFIKNVFVKQGIFEYIEEDLSSRGTLKGIQTLKYKENAADIETIYSEFEKAFFSSNPLIKLAAIDIIKYAYVVEGGRFKKGAISKIIKNNALYTSEEDGGMNMTSESNSLINDLELITSANLTDAIGQRNEIRTNFIRSHANLIPIKKIKKHKTEAFYDAAKTKPVYVKDLNANSVGIIIEDDPKFITKYGLDAPFVRLNDEGVIRLYRVVNGYNYKKILYPLNPLEENEFGYMSINNDNNKYQPEGWYQAVIEDYNNRQKQLEEDTIEYIKQFEDEEKKQEASNKLKRHPKYSIQSSMRALQSQADLAKYMIPETNNDRYARPFDINSKDTPYTQAFEEIIEAVHDRFDIEKGKTLIIRSKALANFIKYNGKLFGSIQTIYGKEYLIQRVNLFKQNQKYIKEGKEVREVNDDVNDMFKKEKEKSNPSPINNAFNISPVENVYHSTTDELPINYNTEDEQDYNVENTKEHINPSEYFSTTEELNMLPDVDKFNNKTIQVMYARRRSFQDPIAIDNIKYMENRGITSSPDYLEKHRTLITRINADYIVHSVDNILKQLNNFKIGDNFYKIDSDEVINLVKTDPKVKETFLKTILDARAFVTNFGLIDQLDISSEDSDINKCLKDVKEAIGKLRSSNVVANAEIRMGNDVLAKLSDNPLEQQGILGVFDGYHTATLFDAWVNDLQETSNPLLQIVSKQVMKDIRKKEMIAKQDAIIFRETITNLLIEAKKAGIKVDWKHIFDDEGKFIQKFNQVFLNKLEELRTAKENAKSNIDEDPVTYYKAKLEFDKWTAININKEAPSEYYIQVAALDEEMLTKYESIYVKYKTLQTEANELRNLIDNGSANPSYIARLEEVRKQIANLTSPYVANGDMLVSKYNLDDPNNPYTDPVLKEIYSIEYAEALSNYRKKIKELDDKHFTYEKKFNFDQELEHNLRIIENREIRVNGKLVTPMDELMLDPEYAKAKKWIANNTELKRNSEVAEKLAQAFKDLHENKNRTKHFNSRLSSAYAQLQKAFDEYGVIDARLLTDEQIAAIKNQQLAEFNVDEQNPFSDRTLITNAPEDDVIFLSSFYNRMKSNGASNPEYIKKINEINTILKDCYYPESKSVHTSELSKENLERLKQLYTELDDIKKVKEGTATNGTSIYNFIKNNVDFVYNWDKFNEEDARALSLGKEYYKKWLACNMEKVEDKNGDEVLVPNHYLYGYAVPKGYEKGKHNDFIDKKKTEALRYIKEHSRKVNTQYYYMKIREMKAKGEEEYNNWYQKNHVYNPYTHCDEPISCWVRLETDEDKEAKSYSPAYSYRQKQVKGKGNPDFIKDTSYSQNYNGKTAEYNNNIEQNEYEAKISAEFKKVIDKYAVTDQAKNFFKQGYTAFKSKEEEDLKKKVAKELLKFIAYVDSNTGREKWLDDNEIDYSKDPIIEMPMTSILKSKESVDVKKNPPKRKENETKEEYEVRYKEWYDKKQADIKKNREIHKKLLDHDWTSAMEEFIIKAGRYNAIQDNKYMLFYAKNMIDKQQNYVKNLGFNKLQKTGNRTVNGEMEYASRIDENLRGQYINWIRRILYEQYRKPNATVTKIMNSLQTFTSAKYMMLNVSGGLANVTQGWNQIMGERFANDYFGHKNWYYGTSRWGHSIGSFIHDMYSDKATSLESAIVKAFNVIDFTEIRGLAKTDEDVSKWISKARDVMFSTLSMGEHFMQNSALFAMLHSHRIYYNQNNIKDGKSPWTYKSIGQVRNEAVDAAFRKFIKGTRFESMYDEFVKYEISKPDYKKEYVWYRKDFTTEFMNLYFSPKEYKKFDKIRKEEIKKANKEFENDVEHPTLMSQLDLGKNGYMEFKNDSLFKNKMSSDEVFDLLADFKGRVISVNKKIHGIYDSLGAAKLESRWLGAIIMQYHKHIYPGIMKRWRRQGYFNEERGTIEKGTNFAILDFIALPLHKYEFAKRIKADTNMTDSQLQNIVGIQNICKAYLEFFTHFTMYFRALPRHEKANIYRGMADFAAIGVAVATAIVTQILGSDDDDNLAYNFIINQADRLATESAAFRSFGLIGEGKKLWSSPLAAQGLLEDIGQTLNLCAQYIMEGDEFDPVYTSGVYKGENKFKMLLKRNTPIWHSIYMLERLSKNNKAYKLDENMLSFIPIKSIVENIKH